MDSSDKLIILLNAIKAAIENDLKDVPNIFEDCTNAPVEQTECIATVVVIRVDQNGNVITTVIGCTEIIENKETMKNTLEAMIERKRPDTIGRYATALMIEMAGNKFEQLKGLSCEFMTNIPNNYNKK